MHMLLLNCMPLNVYQAMASQPDSGGMGLSPEELRSAVRKLVPALTGARHNH